MQKTALITGVTGQDGAYLAKLLLEKGYRVFGAYRRTSDQRFWRLDELGVRQHPELRLVEFDLTDASTCVRLLDRLQPQEVYNLAAQSFVGVSFDQPLATAEINALGPLHLLEGIRLVDRGIRFYQASTSEMFGAAEQVPQGEATQFHPRSPYGAAKLFAHWLTVNYREAHGIFGVSGILFNHESPLRGEEFVTRKITLGAARIAAGMQTHLELGNLEAKRDWGYAPEFVEGMWRMLQAEQPDNYVLATNRCATVREFARLAFGAAGMELAFEGEGADELGIDRKSGRPVIRINAAHYRPAEVFLLRGDFSMAKAKLGWEPKTAWEDLCAIMVEADRRRVGSRG